MEYLQLKYHIENSRFQNKILAHLQNKKNQIGIALLNYLIFTVDIVNKSESEKSDLFCFFHRIVCVFPVE